MEMRCGVEMVSDDEMWQWEALLFGVKLERWGFFEVFGWGSELYFCECFTGVCGVSGVDMVSAFGGMERMSSSIFRL
jgi:hypothetical protein